MKNNLYITEEQKSETTNLHYVVEPSDYGPDVATGTETLRDGGSAEIRDSLRSAAIAHLEKTHNCTLYSIFPSGGIDLPDSISLGSYRDNIGIV